MTTPTTDRELLELAAKAAGIKYDADASKPHPESGAFWGLWLEFDREPSEYDRRYWNPLTDDGDALRLAVKLNLGISIPVHQTIRADVVCFRDASVNVREGGDDPYAAIRRAIVRAAAEIGKAMP